MTNSEQELRRTSLYETHKAAGAKMVPFAGYEMPVQYTGVIDEHHAVREAAGLFDVSHMGEFEARGREAGAFIHKMVTNNVRRLEVGGVLYAAMCREAGRYRGRSHGLPARRGALHGRRERGEHRKGLGMDGFPPHRVTARSKT